MSVGVGVSDILFFVNQTLVLYGQCIGAPAELEAAGRNVEQMRTALEVLSEAVNDRKSLMAKQPAIALTIKHEMKPLREDLMAMNTILNDYIDRSKDMGMIGRVRYAVMDRNKLQSIQSNLTKSRTNFGLMLDLINMKVQEQHARADHAITERLSALLDKQIKESEARKAEAKARANGDAKLDGILQILQDRLPAATKHDNKDVSPSQVLDQLEKELQRVGLSREKAQAARLNAAQALSEKHTSVPMPSLLHPKEEHLEKRRSSDPSPKKSHEFHRSPSCPKDTPKTTSSRKLPELTKDYRILCVDRTHGIRAILAHTYLEVLRVWTANRTGRWLFKRVHSAGLLISTNANKCIDPVAIQGVSSLLANDGYDWASDAPHETRVIGERIKFYNPFGFTAADLSTYHIVLCFTRTDASRISKIKAEFENRARVIVLPGCQDISSADCAKDPGKIGQLIPNMKTAIKGFITHELGDWTDSLERTTNYRTLQLLLPFGDLVFVGPGDLLMDKDKIKDYENKSGCAIKITKYKDSAKEVLLSVAGPKERLAKAVALIAPGTNSPISVS